LKISYDRSNQTFSVVNDVEQLFLLSIYLIIELQTANEMSPSN